MLLFSVLKTFVGAPEQTFLVSADRPKCFFENYQLVHFFFKYTFSSTHMHVSLLWEPHVWGSLLTYFLQGHCTLSLKRMLKLNDKSGIESQILSLKSGNVCVTGNLPPSYVFGECLVCVWCMF